MPRAFKWLLTAVCLWAATELGLSLLGFGHPVLLVADPAKDNKMDFAGMNEGYRQFFANPQQPKKPARITSQVVALASPAFLVEIEVQAAKMP